jgi:carboxypeptidase Q
VFIFKILFLSVLFSVQTRTQTDSTFFLKKYSDIAKQIIAAAYKDSSAWERMAYMCDTFGPRLSGSENLENAIKWLESQMLLDGMDNVRLEQVPVPHWHRGSEYCLLLSPHKANIPMLGLGGSVATPKEGITGQVLVITDFDELEKRKSEATGKIVVFNQPFYDYAQSVQYRTYGAIKAAQAGAIACLIRSVSPIGMQNPHTGMMRYNDTVLKIPAAAITAEYSAMLERMQRRGQNPIVKLYMEAETLPDAISHNVICELKGGEKADEIIAAGGHIDSWDTGTGAQDDGAACIAIWHAIKLLKELGLKPRRTIRTVLWTNEENGVMGGKKYTEIHKYEKHVLMFEFDSGTFPPSDLRFKGHDTLMKIVQSFKPLLDMVEPMKIVDGWVGVDIRYMMDLGVPGMSIDTRDQDKYFWYHHSPADTPDKINPQDINKCVAAIAIALYLYADLPVELPWQQPIAHQGTK